MTETSVLDEPTTRDKIVALLEENKWAHSTANIKDTIDSKYYEPIFTNTRALEREGLIVRERIARRFLWVWKAHIPSGMSTRNYILATFQKPMYITVRAHSMSLAGEKVREYKILGVSPDIIEAIPVTRLWNVMYKWPDNMPEVIEAEEERLRKRAEELRKHD